MTRKKLIETMKANEKMYFRLTVDEKSMLRQAGCDNLEWLDPETETWTLCGDGTTMVSRRKGTVYRIKPDYVEGPNEVLCEVTNNFNIYHFTYRGMTYKLHEAIDIAFFLYFDYADGTKTVDSRQLRLSLGYTLAPTHVVFSE